MTKMLLNIFFCLIIINMFLANEILAVDNIYDSPFLIFNNPSFMSSQRGLPFGVQISLEDIKNNDKSDINFCTAFLYPFENKAFSAGFLKKSNLVNVFVTGFSNTIQKSCIGASLKIENHKDIYYPNLDISYKIIINDFFNISAIGKNLITQYYSDFLYPEGNINFNGEFGRYKFELAYSAVFKNYHKFKPNNGLKIGIGAELLNNRQIYSAIETEVYQGEYKKIIKEVGFYLGVNFRVRQFMNGLLTSYQHNINNDKPSLINNLLINPLFYKDIKAPYCSVSYSCEKNFENKILFHVNCFDENEIKKWSLMIISNDEKNKIIKSFSGGNIPSQLISWDYKDNSGLIFNKDTLKAQVVALDKSGNYSVSSLIIIYPCK